MFKFARSVSKVSFGASSSIQRTTIIQQQSTFLKSQNHAGKFNNSTISTRNFGSSSSSSSGAKVDASLMELGKLNHVAIATNDLEGATHLYKNILGAKVSAPVDLPDHGVTTVFIDLGNSKLELLKPLGENSPIKNFLVSKPGGGIHHVCIEVADIYKAVEILKEKGVKVIDQKPKIGAHGLPVVFLHPKSMNGVLVELEEAHK